MSASNVDPQLRTRLETLGLNRVQVHRLLKKMLIQLPEFDAIAAQIGRATGGSVSDLRTLLVRPDVSLRAVVGSPTDKTLLGLDVTIPGAMGLDLGGFGIEDIGLSLRFSTRGAPVPPTNTSPPPAGVTVTTPPDPDLGRSSGTLTGKLKLGGASVAVEVTARGGAAPRLTLNVTQLPLSALTTGLMGHARLPAGLPDLALDHIQLEVGLTTGELSFTALSPSSWKLPVGVAGVEICGASLTLARAPGQSGGAVSAQVKGVAMVGPVYLELRAALGEDLELEATLPTVNLSSILEALCGRDAVGELAIPGGLISVQLEDVGLRVAPARKRVSLSGRSVVGQAEVVIAHDEEDGWGFTVGLAPPSTWRLSSLSSGLSALDGLVFEDTALILASSDAEDLALTQVKPADEDAEVSRGLNVFASLDMTGLGVDRIIGLTSLQVHAAIGPNPADLLLEAELEGSYDLGNGVVFGDVAFRLKPAPSELSISLVGQLTAHVGDSDLAFTGAMAVTPTSASFQATMLGTWAEPFGAKGVEISDVAIDLGIAFTTLLPVVGIAGSFKIGEFDGSAAVRVDTAVPSHSMLAVHFNRLYLVDVLRTLCGASVTDGLSDGVINTVLNVGFENVDVYVVPQETHIGELVFEQGLRVSGRMTLFGLSASGALELDYEGGGELTATVDELDLGGIFKLSNADGTGGPSLHLEVRPGEIPFVEVDGAVELLGLRRSTIIRFSEAGFAFVTEGSIFGLFNARLEVSGPTLSGGDSVFVRASLQNDLFGKLREQTESAIRAGTAAVLKELTDAQADVESARGALVIIDEQIEQQRKTVRAERERDATRLLEAQDTLTQKQADLNAIDETIRQQRAIVQAERDAAVARVAHYQGEINAAQAEVNRINAEIDRQRNIVQGERDRDAGRLRDAQSAVASAQASLDAIQREINSTYARISSLNQDIANKKAWFNSQPWYNHTWAWAELSGYCGLKETEIGGLWAYIGTLEGSKATANGVLEKAKQTLHAMEMAATTIPVDADPRVSGLFAGLATAKATLDGAWSAFGYVSQFVQTIPIDADPRVAGLLVGREVALKTLDGAWSAFGYVSQFVQTIPIDADPRVAGLFAGRATANGALEAAKLVLVGLEQAATNIPIDADPRVAGLFVGRATVDGELQLAKLTLEGLKRTHGALGEFALQVANVALGGVIDVTAASFAGTLSATHGGAVSLSVTVRLMGGSPQTLALDFDFNDVMAGARALAAQLMPA